MLEPSDLAGFRGTQFGNHWATPAWNAVAETRRGRCGLAPRRWRAPGVAAGLPRESHCPPCPPSASVPPLYNAVAERGEGGPLLMLLGLIPGPWAHRSGVGR